MVLPKNSKRCHTAARPSSRKNPWRNQERIQKSRINFDPTFGLCCQLHHSYCYEIFCGPGIGKCKKKNPHFIIILSSFWNLIKFASDFALDFYHHFILILDPHFILISSSNPHFILILSSFPHQILILSSFYPHFILISGLNEVHETGCKLNEVRQ